MIEELWISILKRGCTLNGDGTYTIHDRKFIPSQITLKSMSTEREITMPMKESTHDDSLFEGYLPIFDLDIGIYIVRGSVVAEGKYVVGFPACFFALYPDRQEVLTGPIELHRAKCLKLILSPK